MIEIEDELLKWRFKRGSREALARIYEKYVHLLLSVAMGLLNDPHEAQDVVQDVFVSFARNAASLGIRGNLRAFLAVCVVNRARAIRNNSVSDNADVRKDNDYEKSDRQTGHRRGGLRRGGHRGIGIHRRRRQIRRGLGRGRQECGGEPGRHLPGKRHRFARSE
ncbi:MAG: hypothetical protein JW955_08605 [Sedimentisphaerales bacterium]|nr:hypothetical protein [Sedimentisphaerales bacterium]